MESGDKQQTQMPHATGAGVAGVLEPGASLAGELGAGSEVRSEGAESGQEHSFAQHGGAYPEWPVLDWLPMLLQVGLPVPNFRVRDLLTLESGSLVVTKWPNGDDLPLSIGGVQLAWVDMETVEQQMAVRLTRLI